MPKTLQWKLPDSEIILEVGKRYAISLENNSEDGGISLTAELTSFEWIEFDINTRQKLLFDSLDDYKSFVDNNLFEANQGMDPELWYDDPTYIFENGITAWGSVELEEVTDANQV